MAHVCTAKKSAQVYVRDRSDCNARVLRARGEFAAPLLALRQKINQAHSLTLDRAGR